MSNTDDNKRLQDRHSTNCFCNFITFLRSIFLQTIFIILFLLCIGIILYLTCPAIAEAHHNYHETGGGSITSKEGLYFIFLISVEVLLFFAFAVPLYFVNNEIKKNKENVPNIDIAMVLLPFVILSLALLFEYKEIKHGNVAGLGAIAGIMILFVLAEIGVLMQNINKHYKDDIERTTGDFRHDINTTIAAFKSDIQTTVTGLSSQSEVIESSVNGLVASVNQMDVTKGAIMESSLAIQEQLRNIPILKHYSNIISPPPISRDDADGDPARLMGDRLEKLVGAWADLPIGAAKITDDMLRVLLAKYFLEECNDIRGSISEESVPRGNWPIETGQKLDINKVAIMATNVNFYSSYLTEVIQSLHIAMIRAKKKETHVPCVGCITTVLPSHLWNWPRTYNREIIQGSYGPIDEYREALFRVASDGANISRLILVSDDKQSNGPGIKSVEYPLWSHGYWSEKESRLAFFGGGPTLTPIADLNNLVISIGKLELIKIWQDNCEWLNEINNTKIYPACYPIFSPKRLNYKLGLPNDIGKRALEMVSDDQIITQGLPDRVAFSIPSLEIYAKKMHPPKSNGASEVWICNDKCYNNIFKQRPDMVFLGVCGKNVTDIWATKYGTRDTEVEWKLCLLANMSVESQTMLLTVVHNEAIVKQLWEKTLKACRNLRYLGDKLNDENKLWSSRQVNQG